MLTIRSGRAGRCCRAVGLIAGMVLGCAGVAVAGTASAQAAVGAPARHAAADHRLGPVAGSAAATAAVGATAGDYARACPVTRKQMACMALTRTNVRQRPQRCSEPGVSAPSTDGYSPAGLQGAYALPSSYGIFPSNDGSGETVAVVDAYNDPNAASGPGHLPRGRGCPPAARQRLLPAGEPERQTSPLPPAANATGLRRSRSTSTWSRRSARTATSSWSRPTATPWPTWAPP